MNRLTPQQMIAQIIALKSVTQRLREGYGILRPSYDSVFTMSFAKKFSLFSPKGKHEFCRLIGGARNNSFAMKELDRLAKG